MQKSTKDTCQNNLQILTTEKAEAHTEFAEFSQLSLCIFLLARWLSYFIGIPKYKERNGIFFVFVVSLPARMD